MRASIWLFSASILSAAAAGLLGACVGDDNITPPDASSDATTDVTLGDGSPGDASTDGSADGGVDPCADASGAFLDASAFLSPGGVAHAVVEIPDGHILVGEYRSVASYGGDAAVTSTNGNTADMIAVRLKNDGSVVWQKGYGGNGSDWASSVTVDTNGDVYLSGYSDQYLGGGLFQGSFNFATTYHPGAFGVVAKLDGNTGAVVWSQGFADGQYTYGCRSIDFDSGNLVVTCGMGLTQSYVGIDGGTGTATASQATAGAIYELDPATGKVVWARALNTSATDGGAQTYVNSVDVTGNNIVVAGTFGGPTLYDTPSHAIDIPHIGSQLNGHQNDGFVVELAASNGAPAWGKGFGDNSGAGNVINTVAAGSSATAVFVGGDFQGGNIDFGSGPHASVGSDDAFVVSLKNKAGAPAWEKYFSGTASDDIASIRTEPCGGTVFGLVTNSTLAPMDGVTIPAPQSTAAAVLVGKIDSSGKLVWANGVTPGGQNDVNGVVQYNVGVGLDGHTATVGGFYGTVNLGSGVPSMSFGNGENPYLILYAH